VGLNIDFFHLTVEYGAESSQWWGAMGVAVIAGLSVATVLTLVVVPVTYHTLDEFVERAVAIQERLWGPAPDEAQPAGAMSRATPPA
jgi:multidrug efflux pump